MKLKKLFSVIGLGLFAVASVSAGVLAFAKGPRMEMAKAEGEKTWMFRAQLDLGVASPDYEDCVIEAEHAVDGVQFHCWGTNVDQTFDAAFMEYDSYDYYGVNVALRDDQIITGAQWILHQKDVGYKYSTDFNKFGDSSNNHLDKDSTFVAIEWQYNHNWVDGKWTPYTDYGNPCYTLQMHIQGQEEVDMVKEPQAGIFAARGMVHSVEGKWIEMISGGSVQLKHSFKEMLDEDSLAIVHGGSDQWTYLNDLGTYDIILGNGHTSIKKHEAATNTWIYYVTNSASATTDYIYSWGGSEQFGAFPGTSIASLVASDEAEEMTGGGVVHFQGGDTAKLIYRINITTGYPTGDSKFMFDNGTSEYKSAERLIQNEHAYWWTGEANHDAAQAINFIEILESRRNAVADTSICNIIEANATVIINAYNAFDESIRETYIDCTTIYTWANKEKSDNTLVTVRAIVEQLAEMYNKPLVGTSSTVSFGFQNNQTTLIAIISVITAVSVAGVVALVVIRKRKHQ